MSTLAVVSRLHGIRWWLFAVVLLLLVLFPHEWNWWSAIAGPLGGAGFWLPWVVALVQDWTPKARRARREQPPERDRIEAARQALIERRSHRS